MSAQANDKKTFTIDKAFGCHYSPFFDAAFNSNFQEGETQRLDLEDVSSTTFDIFVNWLYTQNVSTHVLDSERAGSKFFCLAALWTLADRLLIPRLQNEALVVLDQLRVALHKRLDNIFNHVYENTVEGSPLRRYVVQLSGSWFQSRKELINFERYPREILFDMVNFMRTGDRAAWVKFSEEELKQFFVGEGDTEQKKD
jgi:hypothetical protein